MEKKIVTYKGNEYLTDGVNIYAKLKSSKEEVSCPATEYFGLDEVSTTEGANGYPLNVRHACVGFENADDLNEFVRVFDGYTPVLLETKSGWSLYERKNHGFRADDFEISADDFGDNYMTFTSVEEVEDEIDMLKEDGRDTENMEEVLERVKKLKPNEQVLTYYGAYYDTIPMKSLYFNNLDGKLLEWAVEEIG